MSSSGLTSVTGAPAMRRPLSEAPPVLKRVLFVDDDRHILDGLRRLLHRDASRWQLEFAPSGGDALRVLDAHECDVVVSDMKMPGMDGAALLSEVRRCHPQAARIILSGYSERELNMRAVSSAHRFLAKPCTPETLKRTVERIHRLQALVPSDGLRSLAGGLQALPTSPALHARVVAELRRPHPSARKVSELIEDDPAMSLMLLKVVNSGFFGGEQDTCSVERAVARLGLDTVLELMLDPRMIRPVEVSGSLKQRAETLWRRSRRRTAMARAICEIELDDRRLAEQTRLAASLHDLGEVMFVAFAAADREGAFEPSGVEPYAEEESAEPARASLGAYLAGLWGLPDVVVQAIEHDAASGATNDGVSSVIVHAADLLEREATGGASAAQVVQHDRFVKLGIEDRLPLWRQVARKALREVV